MQVVLVMFRSDGERRSFSLSRDVTVLGRREDCDLRIPLGDVSRKHCRLVKDNDALRLEDLGSSNGTFHNGQRVQEAILSPGDLIQLGPVAFVVQIDGVPADEDIQPPQAEAATTAPLGADLTAATPPPEDAPVELSENDAINFNYDPDDSQGAQVDVPIDLTDELESPPDATRRRPPAP